jgi:hypothetical protein
MRQLVIMEPPTTCFPPSSGPLGSNVRLDDGRIGTLSNRTAGLNRLTRGRMGNVGPIEIQPPFKVPKLGLPKKVVTHWE